MLKLFGFPFHTAPGEAEAECAHLQKEGIVDAVLSEDIDTLMFGSGLTMRNWSSEASRGNKSPTHVNIYEAQAIKNGKSGLDRDAMILVALMSGGDYIPAGIPGCGIKIACQAAKAGFGGDLCKLSRKGSIGLRQFRERLEYELRTNESGYFRTRHKALHIPDNFPDKAVLGYYTHPAVSSKDKLIKLRENIQWNGVIDIAGLRIFVAEAFEWQTITGAKKFIRGLAPALLVHKLLQRGMSEIETDDLNFKEAEEARLVTTLHGRRKQFVTDGMPELRIGYTPLTIVDLDLTKEDPEQCNGEYDSLSEGEDKLSDGWMPSRSQSPAKRRAPSQYDPTQSQKIWILETYVKMGVPLMVETWEEDTLKPKKSAARKPGEKTASKKSGMKHGALDGFVKITKTGVHVGDSKNTIVKSQDLAIAALPPTFLAPSIQSIPREKHANSHSKTSHELIKEPQKEKPSGNTKKPIAEAKFKVPSHNAFMTPPKDSTINPWTLSRRPSDTFSPRLLRGARYSALGIYGPPPSDTEDNFAQKSSEHNDISRCASPSPPSETGRKPTVSAFPLSPKDSIYQERNGNLSLDAADEGRNNCFHPPSNNDKDKLSPRRTRTTTESTTGGEHMPQSETSLISTSETRQLNSSRHSSPFDMSHADAPCSLIANRRFSFETEVSTTQLLAVSTSSSLPSPSLLLSPRAKSAVPEPNTSPCHKSSMFASNSKRSRRLIALRGSLEGAWKRVDGDEGGRLKSIYTGVEVVDLTRS